MKLGGREGKREILTKGSDIHVDFCTHRATDVPSL